MIPANASKAKLNSHWIDSVSRLPLAKSSASWYPSKPTSVPASTHPFSTLSYLPSNPSKLDLAFSSRAASSLSAFFDSKAGILKPPTPLFSRPPRSVAAVARIRDNISARDSRGLHEAYKEVVQAYDAHKQHFCQVAERWQASAPDQHDTATSFQLNKSDIQAAIRIILRCGSVGPSKTQRLARQDAELCRKMFQDMHSVFGWKIGHSDLHYLLWSYCAQDPHSRPYTDPIKAFRCIRKEFPEWKTSTVDWNLVLTALSRNNNFDRAVQLWNLMEEEGIEKGTPARNKMVSLYFSKGMIQEAESELGHLGSIPQLRADTLTIAVHGYCTAIRSCDKRVDKATYIQMARRHSQALKELLVSPKDPNQGELDWQGWHAVLRYEALLLGPEFALKTARQHFDPQLFTARTVNHLVTLHEQDLQNLQTSDDAVELAEKVECIDPERRLKADRVTFSILIGSLLGKPPQPKTWTSPNLDKTSISLDPYSEYNNAAFPTPNQIREAQLLYDHALSKGIVPDAAMASSLISAYCDAFLPSLPSALKLMEDLISALHSRPKETKTYWSREKRRNLTSSAIIDSNLFNTVLRACAKLKEVPIARTLLRQMETCGIKIDADRKAYAAQILMSVSSNWDEAFAIYQTVGKISTQDTDRSFSKLRYNKQGYTMLLDTFRKLDFSSTTSDSRHQRHQQKQKNKPAPPEYLLAIVSDMIEDGYHPSCSIYTSILDYYGKSLNPSYEGVRATHELLKRDERLEPDLPLINALMNAYNFAGAPGPVFAIWESLMTTRQEVDGFTLAILLDTAGRNGLCELARKAIYSVKRYEKERREIQLEYAKEAVVGSTWLSSRPPPQFKLKPSAMNKGVWDTWIECLARCHRLEEAVEIVFGTMRKELLTDAIDSGTILDPTVLTLSEAQPIRDKYDRVIGPDAKTLQTLLKFAAKHRDRQRQILANQASSSSVTSFLSSSSSSSSSPTRSQSTISGSSIWHQVRERVQKEMPWLWDDVKEIGIL